MHTTRPPVWKRKKKRLKKIRNEVSRSLWTDLHALFTRFRGEWLSEEHSEWKGCIKHVSLRNTSIFSTIVILLYRHLLHLGSFLNILLFMLPHNISHQQLQRPITGRSARFITIALHVFVCTTLVLSIYLPCDVRRPLVKPVAKCRVWRWRLCDGEWCNCPFYPLLFVFVYFFPHQCGETRRSCK